ncbi:hypothetical protein ACQ4LE_001299 [Meloidogyne hapla]
MNICKSKCFVRRLDNGRVKQGCGSPCSGIDSKACKYCNKNDCNTKDLIMHYRCLTVNTTCFTLNNDYCYMKRTSNNKVDKGCGNCPAKAKWCKACKGERCNKDDYYFCLSGENKTKVCYDGPNCIIAELKLKNENKTQYFYGCGKCPKNTNELTNKSLNFKFEIKNISTFQCADCKNSPGCNTQELLRSKIFCWEKKFNEWNARKGIYFCDKKECFIGVEKNELALVQGCGSCNDDQNSNLTKCQDCTNSMCNSEDLLDDPITCYHLTSRFYPYESKERKCHHVYDSCFVAGDVFGRAVQNCGDCPSKLSDNCVSCKEELCNEEYLLESTVATQEVTKPFRITTKTKTKKTTKRMTTRRQLIFKSSANTIKIHMVIIVMIFVYLFGLFL